ncbi:MAG: sigma-54-dependent Fis family transcriptional regulator [Deltaproteobacteria bacterium]|nr:sigma-54-dependent Fis family transcriptional regulator [Deltaproteobacteria bacterium]
MSSTKPLEKKTILVVDDEKSMRLVLSAMLKKEGYQVAAAIDGLEAFDIIKKQDISVVVTDLKMPRLGGIGLLRRVIEKYPSLPVIIVTAHGTIANAVEAVKKGAFDYVTKPFDQEDLKNVISKAVKTKSLSDREMLLDSMEDDHYALIGTSKPMLEIYDIIKTVAPTPTTILITGETGTGKELIARAIHENSTRKGDPFIKINCAAIPENLMESELFGYEKGAFTGAVHRKIGRFEQAHKGTLFLDEIGDLPKDMQAKLLRTIQDREFERVGGVQTIKVDVRLVAATNRDLLQDVQNKRFREDLYYRINVLPIMLPSLRERKNDIPLLVEHFIDKFNRKLGRRVRRIEPEVEQFFREYAWPGNIREMENLLERLILLANDDIIRYEALPADILTPPQAEVISPEAEQGSFKEIVKGQAEAVESHIIARVLEQCGKNVTRAADRLGISRKGLQLKMIKYGLRK